METWQLKCVCPGFSDGGGIATCCAFKNCNKSSVDAAYGVIFTMPGTKLSQNAQSKIGQKSNQNDSKMGYTDSQLDSGDTSSMDLSALGSLDQALVKCSEIPQALLCLTY